MTDAQLDLARWLAGSDVWRGWCRTTGDVRVPTIYIIRESPPDYFPKVMPADTWTDGRSIGAKMAKRYLPDITSPLLVGPLIEMLREVDGCPVTIGGKGAARVYCFLDDEESSEVRTTDAEALCALLREVAG